MDTRLRDGFSIFSAVGPSPTRRRSLVFISFLPLFAPLRLFLLLGRTSPVLSSDHLLSSVVQPRGENAVVVSLSLAVSACHVGVHGFPSFLSSLSARVLALLNEALAFTQAFLVLDVFSFYPSSSGTDRSRDAS